MSPLRIHAKRYPQLKSNIRIQIRHQNKQSKNVNKNQYQNSIFGQQLKIEPYEFITASNKRFKADINDYNIDGITIKKGETAYRLITIKSKKYNSLTPKLKN